MERCVYGVRATTGTAIGSVLLLALLSAACDGGEADVADNDPSSSSITLVAYQPQTDGTIKPVAQTISRAEFRALHEARLARQKQIEAGIEVKQGDLVYLGSAVGGTVHCSDPRTTWLYNVQDGWTYPLSSIVLGCFGASSAGDWEGSVSLTGKWLPNGQDWKSAVRSMWVSSSYRAGTESPYAALLYNKWARVNTGYPLFTLWHQL
jgi:hypothetical protein